MKDTILILHFIGLALGLGTSFAHAFLGTATSKMTGDEQTKFRLHTLALNKMGNTGLIILVITGLYLINPYWSTINLFPLLVIKLILVTALIVLIAVINMLSAKAMRGDAAIQFKKMEKLGKITMLIGLTIVILSVTIFH